MLKSSQFSIQVIVNICVSLLVSSFSVALFFVACQFLTDLQGLCLFASLPVCQCCQCSTGAGLGVKPYRAVGSLQIRPKLAACPFVPRASPFLAVPACRGLDPCGAWYVESFPSWGLGAYFPLKVLK